MKTSRLYCMKKSVLTLFLLLILGTTTINALLTAFTPAVEASPEVTVSLDPTLNSKNTGENFTINIDIQGVTNLFSWSLKIGWETGFLTCIDAQEGSFLKGGGSTFFTWNPHTRYVDLACSLLGVGGASGSGTLANATLQVADTGNSTLNLYDVTLLEYVPPLTIIDDWDEKDSPDDSYFYTTFPVAKPVSDSPYNNYFYTPNPYQTGHPIAGETLTFNASACYDPDDPYDPNPGGIVSYQWDFGDETVVTENDPITTHVYATNGTVTGNLTITDDDGETDTEIFTVEVKLHDLAVINVTVTPSEVVAGAIASINVTVLNEGSEAEYLNVTVYYNGNPIRTKLFQYIRHTEWGPELESFLPRGENHTMTWNTTTVFLPLMWDTTGVTPGIYTISAHAYLVNQVNDTWETLPDVELDLADNIFIDGEVNVTDVPIHDIAITSLDVPAKAPVNSLVDIKVTVLNEGNTGEKFNMSLYYDSELIETRMDVILAAGISEVITVKWNTTGIALGDYTLQANVTLIPGEADTADNTLQANVTLLHGPVATFTYSPSTNMMTKETITFNATASYDQDGEIVSYEWDFGDDTTKIYVGANLTAIATHVYKEPKTPGTRVTLTVTDNDGLVSEEYDVSMPKIYQARDIAVTDITLSSNIVVIGENLTISFTVENNGEVPLNFYVTAYYDDHEIAGTQITDISTDEQQELTVSWETSDADPGIYTIKAIATVTPTDGQTFIGREINATNNELSGGPVTLRATSTISVSAYPANITLGESTTINGTISPTRTDADVTIDYRHSGETSWNTVSTVKTDATGSYEYLWTPTTPGLYELRVSWLGDEITLAANSTTTLTVNKMSSTITLDVSSTSVTVGSNITISGSITPARSQVNVVIHYKPNDADWSTLATVTTDANGQYSWVWTPQDTGTYEVKASWSGDENTLADESDVETVDVQRAFPLNIIIYLVVGIAIVVAAGVAFYFLKIRKPKP